MKKIFLISIVILAALFFVLYLDSIGTIEYERESYSQSLLNHEANEFCLRIAMAYCRNDKQMIQEHSLADGLELPEFLDGADMAISGLKQSKYIFDSKQPYATYFIDYYVTTASANKAKEYITQSAGRSVRQTIHIEKDPVSEKWLFKALNYEEIN